MKSLWKLIVVLGLSSMMFAQASTRTESDQPAKKDAGEKDHLQESYYKLAFGIFELEEGKRVNQREYSMVIKSNDPRPNTVKASTRVPIATSVTHGDTQITYIDIGLLISCSMLRELAGKIAMTCDVELSSILPEQNSETHNSLGPVLRTTKASYVWAVLVPGKPNTITTIDDVNSKKRIQVEVTATRAQGACGRPFTLAPALFRRCWATACL
jgi:hypothetical protein